jgi:hypothetical protein
MTEYIVEQAGPITQTPGWPDHLDALVAAPDQHTLLFENDQVRVLDTCIGAGAQAPLHTHRWPAALYILSWSQFIRQDDKGAVVLDSRSVPALQNPLPVLWSAPLRPHSLLNVGEVELHIISVEVKG